MLLKIQEIVARFLKVAKLSEIREDRGKLVQVGELAIALFTRNGELFALNNVCAHQHFSLLHQGMVEGCTVTCPMHGWTYDMRTGKATTGEGRVAVYNVKVQDSDVLIEVEEPPAE